MGEMPVLANFSHTIGRNLRRILEFIQGEPTTIFWLTRQFFIALGGF